MTDFSYLLPHIQQEIYATAYEMRRPSVLYRPAIYPDGTAWCALLGEDIMSGVCGFGDTPEAAAAAFDKAWKTELTPDAQIQAREDDGQFGVGA